MGERQIDQDAPENQENQIALKCHPVRKRACDQSRRNDREHLLEDKICQERNLLLNPGYHPGSKPDPI